ncbi:MAG: oligosaccharide flippase family protein, partial [Clostridia bacterium]|nr:oligosaccharide flippase family protein [Clostridia bacterium]
MVEATGTNTKKTFFSGVLLLSVSTVLVKIVGLIYKIPMLTYLGSEGMGYFNSAYEIYALFCVISTAGLPLALSVLISDALARGEASAAQRIYRASMRIFVLVGVLGSGVMLLFAQSFCQMIQSERAYACILSIAPTVFLVCVSSALRGYFQGYQRMLPTAISQLLESVGKLVFGLLLARYALHRGYDTSTVAAFAGIGLTLGTALSFLYLVLEKLRFQRTMGKVREQKQASFAEKYRDIWKRLSALAIPMTVGASLVSLTKLIDMTMILRRLQSIGYTEVLANEAYGSYTTLALSVYGLLPALVNSIALPLVPMLSASIASGDKEKQAQMIRTSYQLTAL